jgi:transcriptional regulator with XRE-family HTH domain
MARLMAEDTDRMSEPPEVNRRLGEHLRRLRKQKGLSLLDVQALSEGEFKASVVGAYERGERAITAVRLARLATMYRLPLQAMLPPGEGGDGAAPSGVAIDVRRLDQVKSPEGAAVARFIRRLQTQRQDWSEGVVRIRTEDVVALACAVDRTPAELVKAIDDEGLRAY